MKHADLPQTRRLPTAATGDGAPGSAAGSALARGGDALLTVLAGAMLVVVGFQAGGYFPAATASAVVFVLVALAIRVALARRPFAALSPLYVVVAFALGLFAIWTLASSVWSDAPARAVVEYDRALLYFVVFVLVGALGRTPQRLRWMVRAIAAAAAAVCVCALITRLMPDVWAIAPDVANGRFSYPLTYWNALGLLAAIGFVLCLGLTCDDREAPAGRVAFAAALPVLAVTALLTFSRGSGAVAILGIVTLVVVARPRALLTGLLVAVPTVWIALRAGWRADLLALDGPAGTAATAAAATTAQGHRVAFTVAACVLVAALGRGALLTLDSRLAALTAHEGLRRPRVRMLAMVLAAFVALAGIGLALSVSAPSKIGDQYERFFDGGPIGSGGDLRTRLTDPDNNGRIAQWRVAWDAFEEQPLRGEGAGTYALRWDRERPGQGQIEDAHSLYAETLGELGIVGLLLLGTTLLLITGRFLTLARGPDRVLGGALFAVAAMWLVHAGVEWDWELPAVTVWLFAAGGLALAGVPADHRPVRGTGLDSRARSGRVVVSAGCVLLILLPLAVYRSDGPLRSAADAFAAGDCPGAVGEALRSTEILAIRPEPYVIVGYCDLRLGRPDLAVTAFGNAMRRDPGNWEMHYGMALARAAGGRDPRPELRRAQRLNPNHPLPAKGLALFDSEDPRVWRARAPRAPVAAD